MTLCSQAKTMHQKDHEQGRCGVIRERALPPEGLGCNTDPGTLRVWTRWPARHCLRELLSQEESRNLCPLHKEDTATKPVPSPQQMNWAYPRSPTEQGTLLFNIPKPLLHPGASGPQMGPMCSTSKQKHSVTGSKARHLVLGPLALPRGTRGLSHTSAQGVQLWRHLPLGSLLSEATEWETVCFRINEISLPHKPKRKQKEPAGLASF